MKEPLVAAGEPSPDEGLALTRLVLSICMGRGSLCRYARTTNLQIAHPQSMGDYCQYQWRRLLQYLPETKPPALHRPANGRPSWRLRVGSRYFLPAWNMLYGNGGPEVSRDLLSLLGAEAIATLWADRGRIVYRRPRKRHAEMVISGEIQLSRMDTIEAQVVSGWIAALTGVQSTVSSQVRATYTAPVLLLDQGNLLLLLDALGRTWHASAPCLRHRFNLQGRSAAAACAGPIGMAERIELRGLDAGC